MGEPDTKPAAASSAQHTVRTLSLGAFWRILRFPFVLLSAILIPRLMGDAAYGRFAFFLAIYFLMDVITDVGITPIFGRFLPVLEARDPPAAIRFLHGMLVYGVLLTLGAIAIVGVPIFLARKPDFAPSWMVLLCALLLVTKIEGTLFAFIYGRNQIGRFSAKELIRSATTFLFVTGFFLLFGINGAVWALLLSEAVLLAAGVFWTGDALFSGKWRVGLRGLVPYFLFGIRFFIPALILGFLQRTGTVFVRELTGSYPETGFYDVANQFMVMTVTMLALVFTTLLPSASALHTRGEEATVLRWHRTAMTYCGVAVLLALHTLVMLGRPVITACLGAAFSPVYKNACILGAAMPAMLIVYAGMNLSLLKKRASVFVGAVASGLAAMTIGCVFMVPAWNSIGAAWATTAGYCTAAAIFTIAYREEMLVILGGFFRAILAGLVVALLYFLDLRPLAAVLVLVASAVVYLSALLCFRVIELSDALALWRALRQTPAHATRKVTPAD